MFNNVGQTNMRFVSLFLAKMSGYHNQYRRPYETNGTTASITNILQAVEAGGGVVTPNLFQNVGSDFIKPQAAPEIFGNNGMNGISISNGWNVSRYSFHLVIEIPNVLGGATLKHVQGFTEHYDIIGGLGITSSSIDPEAVFTISSIIDVGTSTGHTNNGSYSAGSLKKAAHVLSNLQSNGIQDVIGNPVYNQNTQLNNMRPVDALTYIQGQMLSSAGSGSVYDTRSIMTHIPKMSNRLNGLQNSYLSTLIGGVINSKQSDLYSDTPYTGQTDIYSHAVSRINEAPAAKDHFISFISNMQHNTHVGAQFKMKDILRADPTIMERVTLITGGAAQRTDIYDGIHDSMAWTGSDYETQNANVIFNAMPGLLLKYGLVNLVFTATNRTVQGAGPIIQILNYDSIIGSDIVLFNGALISDIQQNVINSVTMNCEIAYSITMTCNLFTSSSVELQFENRPSARYVSPTFADSLMTPVVTNNPDRLKMLASDVDTLVSSIDDIAQPRNTDQSAPVIGNY